MPDTQTLAYAKVTARHPPGGLAEAARYGLRARYGEPYLGPLARNLVVSGLDEPLKARESEPLPQSIGTSRRQTMRRKMAGFRAGRSELCALPSVPTGMRRDPSTHGTSPSPAHPRPPLSFSDARGPMHGRAARFPARRSAMTEVVRPRTHVLGVYQRL